jgi:hypothetical protein
LSAPRRISDANVAIDAAATPGFLGAASSDGVLRTGVSITYTDGGNFVTLDVVYSNPHTGSNSERFGASSVASGNSTVAFGNGAQSVAEECVSIGYLASADNTSGTGFGGVAIGKSSSTDSGVAVGAGASAPANGMALGTAASAGGFNSVAIGLSSNAQSNSTVCIGSSASSGTSASGIAIGNAASLSNGSLRGVCIGVSAAASSGADDVIAIGTGATGAYSDCILLGSGATATAANQCLIGGKDNGSTNICDITQVYIGRGVSAAAATTVANQVTICGTGATAGSNLNGLGLILKGGVGNGNSTTGLVQIQTHEALASGSTVQTAYDRLTAKVGTELVINDDGRDYDFRVEGDTDTSLLMVDAGADAIGVGVATGSITGKTHISQASTTGAKPVLTLTQKDLSEEFIRLVGESGTDASQSFVDAVDMPTPGTIQGWIRVYVQDDKASGAITDGIYYVPFYSAPS